MHTTASGFLKYEKERRETKLIFIGMDANGNGIIVNKKQCCHLVLGTQSFSVSISRMQLANSVMRRAEAICRNFNATNINMEKVVGTGDAKDVICSAVQKLEAETLVMGCHGYGFFKRPWTPLTLQLSHRFTTSCLHHLPVCYLLGDATKLFGQ